MRLAHERETGSTVKPSREKVQRWVRPEIRALSAYHVPDASGLVKLDAMENPYGWPQELVGAWLGRLRRVSLNRYPDPEAGGLKRRLRQAFVLPDEAGLVLGNGSDELIQMLAMAVGGPGRAVLAPEPTFVMYRMIAAFTGTAYAGVPLHSEGFGLDMDAMAAALERHRPALVFLAYPNNPTGNLFDAAEVRALAECAPGLVVVDEAYCAFTEASLLEAVAEYDNLLVLRTVSKIGLAGLRLGMLVGPPAWLEEVDKVRLPYNINVLTQVSAEFALEHKAVLDEQSARIRADREALFEALAALPGVEPFPSRANFILFRAPRGRANALFQGLLEAGVLIKNLSGAGGALADCLRVTVGRPEENARFLEALRALL
ncbi:MAG: histidinol-phosphate transaminase [Gammaproteobacteria bacterium]|nr:histidinol-phosphate transaminase [Gammaproteobacteria bacterium]NIR98297.1 histidinol-phosphate transaminase [Gammaproteobacteria bacterium]NIT64044.1 histidinol-phosphate transaminase [Gammaproteobacteria bacterium]NIV20975.1 histidinol-phosphate transaminase [Gammaproteobacteria bacterium]NIX10372.1 histidinol-phosphate transaminase [Gammaproteobacteria bacterium]